MSRNTTFAAAAAFAALAFAPAALSAQTCLGLASFSQGSVQLGAGLDFGNDATVYGAGIGVGAVGGGFISGEIGKVDYDETDESSTVFGVNGGWQIPLGVAPSGLQLCPIAQFTYVSGPNDVDTGIFGEADLSGTDLGAGIALGTMLSSSQALSVVPFAAASFHRATLKFETEVGDADSDDTYGSVDLGVGFVANEWITIRPSVSIPFAESDEFDSDPVYSVRFAFNFGKTR